MDSSLNISGWNRPRTKEDAVCVSTNRRFFPALCVFAALAIVITIGITIWFYTHTEKAPEKEKSSRCASMIEIAKSSVTEKQISVVSNCVCVFKPTAENQPAINLRKAPSTAKKYPRRILPRKPEPPQRFKYDCDDFIAGFLEITPGDQIEDGLRFDKIGQDFDNSLSEDVALAEGQDTEANRKLREWVRDTKKEILKVMKEEKKTFGQVMQEQIDQLIELGQYKRELQEQLRDIRKSGEYTPEEYEKFIEASNAMLRGKGCAELKVPKATFYQVELYKQRRADKEANGN